jgi:endoglucanase
VGGTGYCDHVSNVGGDSRVSGCLFSQHIYPWWASHATNGAWASDLAGRVGNYSSSTIITEYGCPMTTGLNYYGTSSTDNTICFMQGVCNQCRNTGMGSCYWPGLRDGDSYSLTTLNYSNYSLSVNNASGVSEVKWGWGN